MRCVEQSEVNPSGASHGCTGATPKWLLMRVMRALRDLQAQAARMAYGSVVWFGYNRSTGLVRAFGATARRVHVQRCTPRVMNV